MPVEGQAERLRTPLGRRDRRLLQALAVVAALALAGGIVAWATWPPPPSNAGCVVVTLASTTGGVVLRNCGAGAVQFCREVGPRNETAAQACLAKGYAVPGRPAPRAQGPGRAAGRGTQ